MQRSQKHTQDGGEGVLQDAFINGDKPPPNQRLNFHAALSTSAALSQSIPSLTQQRTIFSAPSTSLSVPFSMAPPAWDPQSTQRLLNPCPSLHLHVRKQGMLIIIHATSTRPCTLHPITRNSRTTCLESKSGAPHLTGQRRLSCRL
jgi:hypothetical protein